MTHCGRACIDITIDSSNTGPDGLENAKIELTQPIYGEVTLDDGGTPDNLADDMLCYIPEPDYRGLDDFSYVIAGPTGNSCPKRVVMDVQCQHSQKSDNGDALNTISIIILMILTGSVGYYYIRREELDYEKEGL